MEKSNIIYEDNDYNYLEHGKLVSDIIIRIMVLIV